MELNGGINCCGVREIDGLSDGPSAAQNLKDFLSDYAEELDKDTPFRYAMFTQAGARRTGYGFRFASLIEKKGLGTVISTGFNKNPNSGNPLKVWIWTLNLEALKAELKKEGLNLDSDLDGNQETSEDGYNNSRY